MNLVSSLKDSMLSGQSRFPEDMVQEIMLRLPVKSISRYKCVSKSWYSFLNSPTFIARHFSIQSVDHLLILTCSEQTDKKTAYSISNIDDVNTFTELDMLSPYINRDDVSKDKHKWRIHGICDGLLPIVDHLGGDVIICNIATRTLRTLPRSHNQECDTFVSYAGLGYDSKLNDYKVLRIFEFESFSKAEVFSIGTDTCWREIDMAHIPEFNKSQEICLDECLTCYTGVDNILLSFNVADEKFLNVPLPETGYPQGKCDLVFPTIYNKEYALLIPRECPFYSCVSLIDVWVLKKVKTEQSWSKVPTMLPITRIGGCTMTFFKNNTELFYDDFDGHLMVCDLVKKEIRPIYFKDDAICAAVIPYMQTLLCINSRK